MLKLSIKLKVLLILLFLTLILIIAMALNMYYGFNKGFFNYRKSIDEQFNQNLIKTLSTYYQDNKTWDDLVQNKRLWHELINQSSVETTEQHVDTSTNKFRHYNKDDKSLYRINKHRSRLFPPVTLLNHLKQPIIGMKNKYNQELKYNSILYQNKPVGYLATLKHNTLHLKQDQLFIKNMNAMLIRIGLIMIVFAIIISFPIAKYFTSLLKQLTQATKQIAAGDYSIRIQSKRNDELGVLASNFNLLAQSLQSNAQSQKTMIADIAHELRTPISVIIGEIEAIQDGVHAVNENTLGVLHSQISSLKNLVNDLHDLSESDLGSLKYKMEKFDLVSLIENSYENFKLKFSQKQILLEIFIDQQNCHIIGDINRLNQLFNNLLNNSLHYTNQGGKAQIKICQHDNQVIININDSVPGLQTAQLKKIFDRWYRVEKSRSKHSGGSGLGLSICQEIIKAHNGSIEAQHSSLGGIEIIIKLPKGIV
jgi:two-component system sensor histidine kinase BaeS